MSELYISILSNSVAKGWWIAKMLSDSNPKSKRLLWVLALITVFAFQINLTPTLPANPEEAVFPLWLHNCLCSIREVSVERTVMFPAVFLLYRAILKAVKDIRFEWTVVLPAAMFSAFMVLGYSFAAVDSWELVMDAHNGQRVKSAVVFLGCWILFCFVVRGL